MSASAPKGFEMSEQQINIYKQGTAAYERNRAETAEYDVALLTEQLAASQQREAELTTKNLYLNDLLDIYRDMANAVSDTQNEAIKRFIALSHRVLDSIKEE